MRIKKTFEPSSVSRRHPDYKTISGTVDPESLNLCHLALRRRNKTLIEMIREAVDKYADLERQFMKQGR